MLFNYIYYKKLSENCQQCPKLEHWAHWTLQKIYSSPFVVNSINMVLLPKLLGQWGVPVFP